MWVGVESQLTALIRLTIPRKEIRNVMGPGIGELMATHGPYEGLAAAWGEFDAWILASGRTPGPDLWESYVTGPESDPDPAAWRTELNRPLIR